VATSRVPSGQDFFAVVRLDSFRNFTPRPENVTVRKVLERLADAEFEVRHLNATAPTGTVYFIQRTSVVRESKPLAAIVAAPVVAALEALSPRSRKGRAEKKARGKSNKKKARR
jgi:hypothetical protein